MVMGYDLQFSMSAQVGYIVFCVGRNSVGVLVSRYHMLFSSGFVFFFLFASYRSV